MGALLALAMMVIPAPAWQVELRLPSPRARALEVRLTLPHPGGAATLCSDFPGAQGGVSELRLEDGRPLTRVPGDGAACWQAPPSPGPSLAVTYRYDLRRMAHAHGDPDTSLEVEGGFVFNDDAIVLRPEPCPERGEIEIRVELPEGIGLATPWEPVEGEGRRYRVAVAQYRTGSYVALGKLRALGRQPVLDGIAELTTFEGPRLATDEGLRRWVGAALSSVAEFYGALPGGRVHVVLVPVAGSESAGVFGSVLRQGRPSVVLLFGARAMDGAFPADWVPFHELFHLGNPPVQGRVNWFVEGVATYYQDVLRARAGAAPAQAMAADLWDGFRRFCDPEGGRSLAQESRAMRETHRYTRVYWGGACLAFALDVAIRERSGNRRSLDALLRELRVAPRPLSEGEVLAALDAAAGAPRAAELLEATRSWDIEALLRRLGIVPTGPDTVRLDDAAPLAGIRRSILGEGGAPAPGGRGR